MKNETKAQLKQQVAQLQATVASYEAALDQFRMALHGDKFVGFESDGARKDWIATGDVLAWITATNSAALAAGEAVPEGMAHQ